MTKTLNIFYILFSFVVSDITSIVAPAQAETITAKRISSTLRFIPLKKMTVGPDDQYHGTIDPSGQILAFTRKSDLVPHLCSQDIKTGEVTDLLPLTADSQEPVFNAEGELAFTYFKFHAAGDICHKPLKLSKNADAAISCLKVENGEPSTPFWKSSKELGYLLKESWTQKSKIIIENLQTGTKTTLAEGNIWSPSMKPDGRYLFYNEMIQEKGAFQRVLVLKDLQTDLTKTIRFALPGISGFPAVSDDEKYLLFSHYLNDTNNDNVIDGNDNSVIFRVPIQTLLKEEIVFPEQLTSVESNCSFPRPYKDEIYATCAFEGALDIYQLPLTGTVPSQWDRKVLNNAHETSRTYSERILTLNTLKYRFPTLTPTDTSLEERILSNHIMADDLASSKYYLEHLKSLASSKQKDFYTLLGLYVEAREKKKLQKSNEATPSLEKDMLAAKIKIDQVPTYPRFKKILKGLLLTFLNQPKESATYLKDVRFESPLPLPLERYFFFELASWTLPKVKDVGSLKNVYHQMMSAPEFPKESQIYYDFRYLQELQASNQSIQERVNAIQQMNKKLPDLVSSLLKSEAITLKLIQAPDVGTKSGIYRDLDQLMSASRNDYFLRKALNIRAILNFAEAGEFNYLNFIATNWLRYTQNDDTEFSNAREVFAFANLDQAYDSLGKKNLELAGNYFFSSLTLTDDLESHYGYIKAKIAKGQRSVLDERYKNLKDHQQIEDNLKFVDALLILMDAHPESRSDVKHLDGALEKLKTMEQDRDSAVRYLLMGYCSLEKLLRLGSGYEFDSELFENAHRNLMLAYDQGFDNDRIQASALMNLGLLHQRVQNHGLAAKFFLKRKALGFVTAEESAQFAWFYAKSLFYSHQSDQAIQEIGSAKNLPASYGMPFRERLGFYLQTAGKYPEATQVYKQILETHAIQDTTNLAKIYLSYGYCLFKLKKEKEAQSILEQALQYANNLKIIPKGQDRWIDFQPVRLKLVVLGLLSQIGPTAQRLEALETRDSLLKESPYLMDQWLSNSIQNELKLAYLYRQTDGNKAAFRLKEALKRAIELAEQNQYLSNAVYHTEVAFMVHAILNPKFYEKENSNPIQKLVEKTIQTYNSQKSVPILEYQKIKLQLLWATYSTQVLKSGSGQEIKNISDSESFNQLKDLTPDKWDGLRSMANALKTIHQ